MKYEIEYIEKIAKVITDNGLSEIILEDGEQAITIRKDNYSQPISDNKEEKPKNVKEIQEIKEVPQEKTQENHSKANAITSPMVGAFYASPTPGAKPFVQVGDVVSTGQVVCIVEAMKLMNEIESEVSGRITKICVEDGQSVEYGQVLMYVE